MKESSNTSRLSVVFIMLIFTPLIIAVDVTAYKSSGNIGLLTVSESANGSVQRGGTADLFLAIKPGTGRIFIDSFPLSKLDTQITMRFASEMACDFLNIDCSRYDFFYTIRAQTAIVGGPSAGAAATVLTVAMLDNQNMRSDVIMTGTINSGYFVGPVAGISAKTLAAQNHGYKKVLIPKWDLLNDTFDGNLTIPVIPISDLNDALFQFTGKNYSKSDNTVYTSDDYNKLMQEITTELCSKYGTVSNGKIMMPNLSQLIPGYDTFPVDEEDNSTSINNTTINVSEGPINSSITVNLSRNSSYKSTDYFQLALAAIDQKQYYSAASFCFGGDVRITRELMKDYSSKRLKNEYAKLLGNISVFEEYLNQKADNLSTISELETYMVVRERLDDAKKILSNQNPENISSRDLAYAIERFDTARVWSKFFELSGKEFVLDTNALSIACNKKLEETEERINYLQLYYPQTVNRDEISAAYDYQDAGEYAMCIFTASKAKADIDVVLGALFVPESKIKDVLDEKLSAARNAIAHQESNQIFPMLGYSYYEYSNTLKDTDVYSALIYAEYGLELSNLDMYLPVKKSNSFQMPDLSSNPFAVFFLGFSIGILFVILLGTVIHLGNKPKHNKDDSNNNNITITISNRSNNNGKSSDIANNKGIRGNNRLVKSKNISISNVRNKNTRFKK